MFWIFNFWSLCVKLTSFKGLIIFLSKDVSTSIFPSIAAIAISRFSGVGGFVKSFGRTSTTNKVPLTDAAPTGVLILNFEPFPFAFFTFAHVLPIDNKKSAVLWFLSTL